MSSEILLMFLLFDVVRLIRDIPQEKLYIGMIGTIIDAYTDPFVAYEVEFCDSLGITIKQLALLPEQLS